MIHATEAALDKLEPLLSRIRQLRLLKEQKRGIFYFKSKAFLHFHEDTTGLFADVRIADEWCRLPVNQKDEQVHLVDTVANSLLTK